MPLTQEQREEFLATARSASISIDTRDGRGPLTVPIWYARRPGGPFTVATGRDTHKARLLAAAGRCTLLVQRDEPTYRYVSAEGPVTLRSATADDLRAIAGRYLADDVLAEYVENSFRRYGPDGLLLVEVLPERWLSADLGAS